MITKEQILGQLETLIQQKQTALVQVQQIDGAIKMCRMWLAKLEAEQQETTAGRNTCLNSSKEEG